MHPMNVNTNLYFFVFVFYSYCCSVANIREYLQLNHPESPSFQNIHIIMKLRARELKLHLKKYKTEHFFLFNWINFQVGTLGCWCGVDLRFTPLFLYVDPFKIFENIYILVCSSTTTRHHRQTRRYKRI